MDRYLYRTIAAIGLTGISQIIGAHISYAADFSRSIDINWEASKQRCMKPDQQEPILTQRDFRWNMSHGENRVRAKDIYQSGKRLYQRSYFDTQSNSFIIPHKVIGKSSSVKINRNFISNIKHHIETSLKNQYTEAIVFSDMGHSHLFFPKKHWDENYQYLVKERNFAKLYEAMFADPKLHVLYHTAEQIKLKENGKVLPDPHSQWRYWNRNILGYNRRADLDVLFAANNKRYNTIIEIPGFHRWSAGFNISASKDGCFPFSLNGKTHYFDISLTSMPYRVWSRSKGSAPQLSQQKNEKRRKSINIDTM